MRISAFVGILLLSLFSRSTYAATVSDNDLQCLSKIIYSEARAEHYSGQIAVGTVVLNRIKSPHFPSTVCGVMKQRTKFGCQFYNLCDRPFPYVIDKKQWETAKIIAKRVLRGEAKNTTLTRTQALFFHAKEVSPSWNYKKVLKLGNHYFYSEHK